jgi:hypothetical protein
MLGMPVEWEVDTSSAAGNENPGTAFPPSPISKVLFLQRISQEKRVNLTKALGTGFESPVAVATALGQSLHRLMHLRKCRPRSLL